MDTVWTRYGYGLVVLGSFRIPFNKGVLLVDCSLISAGAELKSKVSVFGDFFVEDGCFFD